MLHTVLRSYFLTENCLSNINASHSIRELFSDRELLHFQTLHQKKVDHEAKHPRF